MKNIGIALTLLALCASSVQANDYQKEPRWWKGNTHTHSWWSDGDTPPEVIAAWYKKNGYEFLVFSDHNIMQQGEKWYPIDKPPRRPEQIKKAYNTYVKDFGKEWVEERKVNGNREVKLKTLDEFRSLFEESGKFIFIKGEEITDRFEYHPVHMNGVNLVEHIEPKGGTSVANTIQNNLDSVVEQSHKHGQPMLAHLNHPNFHYAQTAEDFFFLNHKPGDGFFEMYNGHPGVDNYGDELHQSTERMWDIVLSKRLGEYKRSVIYGVAVDDAHEYTEWGLGETNPGRGWIMVRSEWLTPNKITEAIKRGDFYNSTGVTLKTLNISDKSIDIEVNAEKGVSYQIEFVGTQNNADLKPIEVTEIEHQHQGRDNHLHQTITRYSDDIGKVLKTVKGKKASYKITGDEIYVRARITSTKAHPNPFADGDTEMAWTQPLVVKTNNANR